MKPDRAALLDVIESVADGAKLDWDALEADVTDEGDRRMLAQLRILARIAEVHRSLPDDPADHVIPTRIAKIIPMRPPATVDESLSDARNVSAQVSADDKDAKINGQAPHAPIEPPPSAPVEPATPATIGTWGPLELLERIGQGTFGEVYRARDALQREVAVKLLRSSSGSSGSTDRLGEKVLREARILARIRHSHVVTVYNAETHDGRVGLWMELIRGATLEHLLKAHGAFGAREAAFIGQDLCRALAAVHTAGLVHRDIKAQNVMREEGGRVVLMDFGAGQVVGDSATAGRITGTPLYLAPEVLRGADATVRSDIYSLGVLLYHLVTNDYPVRAKSLDELRAAHGEGRRVRLHDARPDSLPDSLVRVIERALDPDPTMRYATAGEMQAELAHAVGVGILPSTMMDASAAAPTGWRAFAQRPSVIAAAVVALVVVAAVAVRVGWRGGVLAPTPHTIAVLPLERGEGIEPYQADDITDGIHQVVSMGPDIAVISSRSVRVATQSNLASADIAKKLHADALVEGRVARDGKDLHLTLRLISAGTDASFWSGEFVSSATDPLALQRDAGAAVAGRLGVKLPIARLSRFTLSGAQAALAQDRYARARAELNRGRQDAYSRAVQLFTEAVTIEPSFAQAQAGLARASLYAALNPALPTPRHFEAARDAASRALAIDDTLAEAHAVIGQIDFMSWKWREAEQSLHRAVELNPNNEYAREKYAFFLAARGRPDQGVEQSIKLRELDPLSPTAAFATATSLQYARRYDEALAEIERALRLDSSSPIAHVIHGRILAAVGRFDEAKEAFKHASATNQGGDFLRSSMACADAGAGRTAEALTVAHDLERKFAAMPEHAQPEVLGYLYATLGDHDNAFVWLTRAFDVVPDRVLWIKVDPRLDPLRADPRFALLLARLGLQP
jgi:tetratricopeptide (TPR) repeat protein/TolB-like protein